MEELSGGLHADGAIGTGGDKAVPSVEHSGGIAAHHVRVNHVMYACKNNLLHHGIAAHHVRVNHVIYACNNNLLHQILFTLIRTFKKSN